MTAAVSGVILVVAFVAVAVLAAFLVVAAFRRAGAREATHTRDQRLSLRHGFRARHFPARTR